MRALYAERQAAVVEAAERTLGGDLDISPAENGLHLIGWLRPGFDDQEVAREAAAAGVDVWPLSIHALDPQPHAAILLGFASVTAQDIRLGMKRLGAALARVAKTMK
jgi:GntR family transcriptional regulator/MocR family aminotransferase